MLLIYTIVAGTIPLMVFPAACHEPPTQLASGAISGWEGLWPLRAGDSAGSR